MEGGTEIAEATQTCFIDLYKLADKVQAQSLKRQMIDAYYDLIQKYRLIFMPNQKLLRECYEKTSAGSAVRAIFIATWAWVGSSHTSTVEEIENAIKGDLTDIPEIARDLACELLHGQDGRSPPFSGSNEKSKQFYEPSMHEGVSYKPHGSV